MTKTTCPHGSDNPVMVIMPNGVLQTFCDLDCLMWEYLSRFPNLVSTARSWIEGEDEWKGVVR